MRAWKSTSSSDSCWGSPSSTASSLISKCPWYGNPLLSFCSASAVLCFCYSSFTPHLFLIPLSFQFPFLFLLLGFLSTFIIYLSVFFLLFVGFVHIYRHPSLPPFLHLIPCYFSSLPSFKFSLHLPSSKYPFFPPPLLLSSATPFKSFIPYTYTHLTHSSHTLNPHTQIAHTHIHSILIMSTIINVQVVYKKLKGLKPVLSDLLDLQPSLANGLQRLLDFEGNVEVIEYEMCGVM